MKRLIFFLMAMFIATSVSAQAIEKQKLPTSDNINATKIVKPHRKGWVPFSPQHEVRVSIGYSPLSAYIVGHSDYYPYPGDISPTIRGPKFTTGVLSLSYNYRFRRWFDFGLLFSYYNEYYRLHSSFTNEFLGRVYDNYITIMPSVRFTWLNRKWVRMYSSLGLGVTINTENQTKRKDESHYTDFAAAAHLTYLGITVGKSLFGFAELGIGAKGLATIGIGYRFNNPNKKQ